MSIEQQIIGALDGVFSLDKFGEQDRKYLAMVYKEIEALSTDQKAVLSNHLANSPSPPDNEIPLWFFLYDCLGDIRFLEKLIPLIPESPSLPWYYEFHWNISQRLFTNPAGSGKLKTALRQRFDSVSQKTRQFLTNRGLVSKKMSFDAPKKIAILVPQLLNLRHSPTREAFNIALHLNHYHDCQTYIINTNGMTYKSCNLLNLFVPAYFHTNESLQGQQKIPIQYMQFDAEVDTVSFAHGAMTSQKIAQIANALQQLEIEAVISHGDNLVVMESLYGFYPSLFATTGSVVPFNHCDAYFIPGDLFSDSAKKEAEKYAHNNFMLESMLVTPEGQADKPAARSEFGLSEQDFLYLVVGTRLSEELNREFNDLCCRLLAQNSDAKILFAGTSRLELKTHFDDQLVDSGKVVNIGFQDDLPAISAMSDAYLNPNRLGGGTSAQTALLNGLPVVTLNQGHISTIVPEEQRHADWQSYFAYANKLQQDPEFLVAEGNMFKQHFLQNLDSAGQIARMYAKLVQVSAEF